MSWLPRSRKVRQRLLLMAVVAPVIVLAVALSLRAMTSRISLFYTPGQAAAAGVRPGQAVQLGGLVSTGSVQHFADGRVSFAVEDASARATVSYRGDLPDLFREGQGIVASGTFVRPGQFEARQVLAKHDETYMPKEVANALKEQGEWRGNGQTRKAATP